MAVKFTPKSTTQPKTKVAVSHEDKMAVLADEIGEIETKIIVKNAELLETALAKEIQELTQEAAAKRAIAGDIAEEILEADQPAKYKGSEFQLDVSAKRTQTSMKDGGKEKAFEFLGEDTFFELCTISIGDLRKYLNPKQLAEILNEEKTGARTLKVKAL